MNNLSDRLEKIGFSANEARAYITLLAHSPCTAYELGKNSEVSRTMIYDIIKRLIQKNAIVEINSKSKYYAAVPYNDLLKKYKEDYLEEIESIKEEFDKLSLNDSQHERYIININGYEEMVVEVGRLIQETTSELYLSLWPDEAELFRDVLQKASERGVNIILFTFGRLRFDFGTVYQYGLDSELLKGIWSSRKLVVISDREKVIIGEGNSAIEEISYVTSNSMIVEMSIEQVALDIIHLTQLKKLRVIEDSIATKEDYFKRMDEYYKSLAIDFNRFPKRIIDD